MSTYRNHKRLKKIPFYLKALFCSVSEYIRNDELESEKSDTFRRVYVKHASDCIPTMYTYKNIPDIILIIIQSTCLHPFPTTFHINDKLMVNLQNLFCFRPSKQCIISSRHYEITQVCKFIIHSN